MILINNRDKLEWKEDMTVQDLLTAMGFEYVMITVTVNGTLVPAEDYDKYMVPDDSDVGVFHLAHGG